MYPYPVIPAASVFLAIGATSDEFEIELSPRALYVYSSDVATWIGQGADPTASAGAGSMFVPAKVQIQIAGLVGAKVAAIRAAGDGNASLTQLSV